MDFSNTLTHNSFIILLLVVSQDPASRAPPSLSITLELVWSFDLYFFFLRVCLSVSSQKNVVYELKKLNIFILILKKLRENKVSK